MGKEDHILMRPSPWQATSGTQVLAGLTVLVIEDSRIASEALRLLCLRSGARIRRADSTKAALRHLQTYRPCCAIVDMGLPDGDGADIIRTISQTKPRVPVIIGISGDADNRQTALDAGASGFLVKPIEGLALFQQTILAALPRDAQPRGLRVLPNDVIAPQQSALRDDLARVANLLDAASDADQIQYIAQFVAGIARSAHDHPLELAAIQLADGTTKGDIAPRELENLSLLVSQRLASFAA